MVHAYSHFGDGLNIVGQAPQKTRARSIDGLMAKEGRNVLLVDDLTETAGTLIAGGRAHARERRAEGFRLRFARFLNDTGNAAAKIQHLTNW